MVDTATDLLVVAAFEPELARLSPPLVIGARAVYAGLSIETRVLGVGLPRASAQLARAVDGCKPSAVVLVGSCGIHAGIPWEPGCVVVAHTVSLANAAVLSQRAVFPAPLVTRRTCDPALVKGFVFCGAHAAHVGCTLAMTTDNALADGFVQAGLDAEHLEAFALDAAPAGVPCVAVLAVANHVGANGRDEWRLNAARAHDALAVTLLRWLDAGAPGLEVTR